MYIYNSVYIYMNYTWVNTIISEIGLDVCGGFLCRM